MLRRFCSVYMSSLQISLLRRYDKRPRRSMCWGPFQACWYWLASPLSRAAPTSQAQPRLCLDRQRPRAFLACLLFSVCLCVGRALLYARLAVLRSWWPTGHRSCLHFCLAVLRSWWSLGHRSCLHFCRQRYGVALSLASCSRCAAELRPVASFLPALLSAVIWG